MTNAMMAGPRDVEDEIWIVLAACEAGALIDSQIESILAQTHPRWRLLIRDDASQDGTARRIDAWAQQDPRIAVLDDGDGRLGTTANFSRLLRAALDQGAAWVALADQDDVWKPTKLEKQHARVQALGLRDDEPALVHSDLEVVGPDLTPLQPSLLAFQGLRHEDGWPLPTLLIQNFVTGCTCLASRALLELALPIPGEAVMHDWWLALCAASAGTIGFVPDATVYYRQHAASQVGAKSYRRSLTGLLARTLLLRGHSHEALLGTVRQVGALRRRLAQRQGPGTEAHQRASALLDRYLALFAPSAGRLARVWGLHRLGARRQDRLRDATFKLKLLALPLEPPPTPGEDSGNEP